MLRKRLQTMTEVEDGVQHPALLEALTKEYPNTIRIVHSDHPLHRYTCLVHAFGFTEQPEYIAIASRPFNRIAYASPEFAHWLLDRHFLQEIARENTREGDLVLYFDDNDHIKHAGLCLNNDRVLSKWGLGYLYSHATLEVPETYGCVVRYFKRIPLENALDHFKIFAKEKGMILLT